MDEIGLEAAEVREADEPVSPMMGNSPNPGKKGQSSPNDLVSTNLAFPLKRIVISNNKEVPIRYEPRGTA
jgi:hypothetical protein